MLRGLVWACAGLVVVGLLLRLSGAPAPDTAAKAPSPRSSQPTPTPAPSSSSSHRETRERLLNDDALTPPPATASKDEQRAYRSIMDAIARGQDPLAQQLAAAVREEQREALQKRMEVRRHAAEEHRKAQRARSQAMLEAKRAEREEKRRANEGRVLPPPLIPPLDFGPPVTGLDEKDLPAPKKP